MAFITRSLSLLDPPGICVEFTVNGFEGSRCEVGNDTAYQSVPTYSTSSPQQDSLGPVTGVSADLSKQGSNATDHWADPAIT
jgi:hypothetical protein